MNEAMLCESQRRENWRAGKGDAVYPGWGNTMLRPSARFPDHIETSDGYAASTAFALRLWQRIRHCQKTRSAWYGNMRDKANEQTYRITVTHAGDVRIGCTMLHRHAFERLANDLDWRW